MARNVIELVAQWRDQGVARGLQETSRSVTMLTNALGTAAGFGAIGAINVLARHLGTLVRAPFEAANAMAQLARQGEKVAPVFKELAKSQDEAASAWRQFSQEVARSAAPTAKALAEVSAATGRGGAWFAGGLAGFTSRGQFASPFRGAGSALPFRAELNAPYGPFATAEELEYAKRLEAIRQAEQAVLKEINKELERAKELDRQRMVNAQTVNASLYGIAGMYPQTYTEYLGEGVQQYGPQTWEEWIKAGQPVAEIAKDPQAWASQAASSVSSAITFASSTLVSGLATLGGVARAFWTSLVGDIISILGQMAASSFLGPLLSMIGTAIGGPLGGVIGKVGGKLAGKLSAAPARGGNTIIFQGINTRDAYMSFQRGELGRAMDLQRLRAEVV